MKTYPIFFILLFCIGNLTAQPSSGLIAYYPFDDCTLDDATGTNANNGTLVGEAIGCECGVSGQAIRLNVASQADYSTVIFPGPFNDEFDDENFTLSLYFKPIGINGTMDIFSKREDGCVTDATFAIRYTAASNFINIVMTEDNSNNSSISYQLPFGQCWYNIVVQREGLTTRLFVNGELAQQVQSSSRIDLSNNEFIKLSGSSCINMGDQPFDGLIDELRMYNRALSTNEIKSLYLGPDRLQNENNVNLYLGNSVDILPSSSCAYAYEWSPVDGVDAPDEAAPTITPIEEGVFTYEISYIDSFCVSTDTIRINVIDPADLDCNLIFLPKAFTPNGHGPAENERYGVSNPEAMEELISFEIFDRWGSKMFSTTDPFDTWDGRFKMQEVNPGVFLYKIAYSCKGEEQVKSGSLTLIR